MLKVTLINPDILAALALCGRSPSKLKETLEMVAAAAPHARVFYRAFDITDEAVWADLAVVMAYKAARK